MKWRLVLWDNTNLQKHAFNNGRNGVLVPAKANEVESIKICSRSEPVKSALFKEESCNVTALVSTRRILPSFWGKKTDGMVDTIYEDNQFKNNHFVDFNDVAFVQVTRNCLGVTVFQLL